MWFWKRQHTCDACKTAARRIEDLESAWKRVRDEWQDTDERLSRLVGRLSKRASRDLRALEPVQTEHEGSDGGADAPVLDEVTKRRQARVFPGGGR